MFYDLEDPVAFASDIEKTLDDEGVWVFEQSYLPLMIETNSFDTICHEHLEYYSLAVLENIMARAGLRIYGATVNDVNGGSTRCFVTHKSNLARGNRADAEELKRLRHKEFDMALDKLSRALDHWRGVARIIVTVHNIHPHGQEDSVAFQKLYISLLREGASPKLLLRYRPTAGRSA